MRNDTQQGNYALLVTNTTALVVRMNGLCSLARSTACQRHLQPPHVGEDMSRSRRFAVLTPLMVRVV